MTLKPALAFAASIVAGVCLAGMAAAADFRPAARAANETIRANHYRPAELDSAAYRRIEADVAALGETATSADEFLKGFNDLWRRGPFSHVSLRRAEEPAAVRIARNDTLLAGDGAVSLAWQGRVAILTVNTMNGVDTVQKIDAAYDEIAARGADTLILDLRANTGGAFAVVPLVGHLIRRPTDAGVFATRLWSDTHAGPPSRAAMSAATPWRGYSVRAFQDDLVRRPLTSYRIDRMAPHFAGRVFVLTSRRSVSAAEIAADVLQASGRATIIGERTPGAVLSSKLFDIPGGFHLRVPIADYYSLRNGRIEGVGVAPDVPVAADRALDVALSR